MYLDAEVNLTKASNFKEDVGTVILIDCPNVTITNSIFANNTS